jgi:regulator of PEP synthase PpsR (kinase-PPPase family)
MLVYDLFGDLMARLRRRLGQVPKAEPGRYRALRHDYYERIEAIEFSIEHDDSQNLATLDGAEIVLIGVSRSGKTPLSMYLAMHGWKTANVSFLPGLPWPVELESVDRQRLVGLVIDRERLMGHRRRRSVEVGFQGTTNYSSEESLFLELEELREELKRHRISTVDVTEKPIETTAQEVIQRITSALGEHARKR